MIRSLNILTSLTLFVIFLHTPMAMENPTREMDELAAQSLQKLDDQFTIIQNYLCKEVSKIRCTSKMKVGNNAPRELTESEKQKEKRLDALSNELIAFQKNSKDDALFCPFYLNKDSIDSIFQKSRTTGFLTKYPPYVRFTPKIIYYKDYSSLDIRNNEIGSNPLFIDALEFEWEKTDRLNLKTLLSFGTILTEDQNKTYNNKDENKIKLLVEELSKPDYYLRQLDNLCQHLYIEIAQPWCGSNTMSTKYINNDLLPKLKNLKFENQEKILALETKVDYLNEIGSNTSKIIGLNISKTTDYTESVANLCFETKTAEKLTHIIQTLEAISQLVDTFSEAFRDCAKERELRYLEQFGSIKTTSDTTHNETEDLT